MKRLRLKILVPVAIGLGVVAWLFHGEFSSADLSTLRFTPRAILGIALAWLAMMGRDLGLTWRFREITRRQLSWLKALKVNMLCEFTSAVTPSSVGGSTLGVVYMHREGVDWGRSTMLMLTTLFADELFFVVACPLTLLLVPYGQLLGVGAADGAPAFVEGLRAVFWTVYGALALWTATLYVGLFLRPQAVRALLLRIFRLPGLRRWSPKVEPMADNIVATSHWLRGRRWRWWLRVLGATALSWCSRFGVLVMLFWGFLPQVSPLVVFARQFIVWVVLMVSPTPGGAGISEWIFKNYYGDLVGTTPAAATLVMLLTVCWRVISYYVYLAIGACIVPRWIADGLARKPHSHNPNTTPPHTADTYDTTR